MFFCVVYVLCDVWHCSPNPHDKSSSSNRSSKSEEEKKPGHNLRWNEIQ